MKKSNLLVCIVLFALTFVTTTLAGIEWLLKDPYEIANFDLGIPYSSLLLLFLLSHELGHYFAARYHGVQASYPFFLPFPSYQGMFPFGTFGAVIRIRQQLSTKKELFDIGAAGPIAGFAVSVAILAYGFANLPSYEYILGIHPEYANLSSIPNAGLTFGTTLLFRIMSYLFAPSNAFIPPMNEVYHYPFLCVGWFGLLVTALNLLPVGQLDGGHLSYCMFGRWHRVITSATIVLLTILGVCGLLPLIGIKVYFGWPGWLLWAILLFVFIRLGKGYHPPTTNESPIGHGRFAVGIGCWIIFLLSFSPNPLFISS